LLGNTWENTENEGRRIKSAFWESQIEKFNEIQKREKILRKINQITSKLLMNEFNFIINNTLRINQKPS
jgi:hypothetical protein